MQLSFYLDRLGKTIAELEDISQDDSVYPSARALANQLLDRCYTIDETQIVEGNYSRLKSLPIKLLLPNDFATWIIKDLERLFKDIDTFKKGLGRQNI